ncbi:hypothetical protein SAMN04487761_12043 [Lachnospiraceae bacterium C7]|nr:hypothetical protein SAMN04487761_12043 [Lachnospiraceae bacterium C7]
MLKVKSIKPSKISWLNKNDIIGDILLKIFACFFAIMLVFVGKIEITNGIGSNNTQAVFLDFNIIDLVKFIVFYVLTYFGMIVLEKVIDKSQSNNIYEAREKILKCFLHFLSAYF